MNRKKRLKDQIHDGGFFINFVADHIKKDSAVKKMDTISKDNVMFRDDSEIPTGENIIIMSGLLSQNYPIGKKSRNGYKIVQTGVDYSDYKLNNIVLLGHNDELGGIGRTKMVYLDNAGNSNIIMYVDVNTIKDESTRYQIKNGFIKGVSTGHSLVDYRFEDANDGGKLLKEEDAAEKYGWGEVFNAFFGASSILIYTITKSLMVENSVVTLGSNEKAVLSHDTIGNIAIKNAFAKEGMIRNLFNDKNNMSKKDLLELINSSNLTKKDKAELVEIIDAIKDEDKEELDKVKNDITSKIEDNAEAEEEVIEEVVAEEVVAEEVVAEEVVAEEVVAEEVVAEEVVAEEVVAEEVVAEEVVAEEVVAEEVVAEEVVAEEVVAEEVVAEEVVAEEVEVGEQHEGVVSIEDKLRFQDSFERQATEISSLKDKMDKQAGIIDGMQKVIDNYEIVFDSLADVIDGISDNVMKNTSNLAKIVTLGVSDLVKNTKQEGTGTTKLRNVLQEIKKS